MEFSKVVERINFLYRKSQEEGLTEEEKQEQKELRKYYIEVVKNNFKVELNKVKFVPKN